ncbi:murein L,D-transpeptidase family protein [Mesorhizobium sp. CAU 1741]|uniref:murein L,D-transpeptidase family protein n=1 Tax=Mesorhizobium sp. CAU 1741 TaxID=3140366 RepID=UPI00325A6657
MNINFARAGILLAALALAGCNETLEDIAPKAEKSLPPALVQSMRAQGMSTTSPIMVRIFKEEAKLEVWKQKDNGRYDLATTYDICTWSGKLGPKFTEGDRQAPEGFYMVRPHQMNPKSQYHLAFNMGFPNSYDRAHGRSGQHLMVHGACSSAGCYSMTDPQMEQIYAFARDAFKGGQTEFQVQAFPFRMTPANMARYKDDPNYAFWTMLKEGYDHFEITKVPPKVDVCGRRYVFNQTASDGRGFSPTASCPVTTQPDSLRVAYSSYQNSYETAFSAALGSAQGISTPAPTIAGMKEASLVADWSRRRARGERVTRQPPSLDRPEILMAEQERKAQPPALKPTVAAVPTPAPAEQQAVAPAAAPMSVFTNLLPGRGDASEAQPQAAESPAAPAPSEEKRGLGSRLLGMFGG